MSNLREGKAFCGFRIQKMFKGSKRISVKEKNTEYVQKIKNKQLKNRMKMRGKDSEN